MRTQPPLGLAMPVVGSGEVERFFFFWRRDLERKSIHFQYMQWEPSLSLLPSLRMLLSPSSWTVWSLYCRIANARPGCTLAHLSDALPPATCPQSPLPCLDRGFCPGLHLSPHLFPVCFISILPLCGNFDPNPTETICPFQKIHTPLSHSSVFRE